MNRESKVSFLLFLFFLLLLFVLYSAMVDEKENLSLERYHPQLNTRVGLKVIHLKNKSLRYNLSQKKIKLKIYPFKYSCKGAKMVQLNIIQGKKKKKRLCKWVNRIFQPIAFPPPYFSISLLNFFLFRWCKSLTNSLNAELRGYHYIYLFFSSAPFINVI